MHVVSAIGDVQTESVSHYLTLVGLAVAISVAHAPNIRGNGGVDVAFVPQDAGSDAGHLRIELFGIGRALVQPCRRHRCLRPCKPAR